MRHPALRVLLVPLLLGVSACVSQSDSSTNAAAPAVDVTDASQLGLGDITDQTVRLWDDYLKTFDQTTCVRGLKAGVIEKGMGKYDPATDRRCVEFYFEVNHFDYGDCAPAGRYAPIDLVKDTMGEPYYLDSSFGFSVLLGAQTARTCDLLTPVLPDDFVRVRGILLEAKDGWAYFELVWVGDTRTLSGR